MELRDLLFLAAALVPAVVIAAPAESSSAQVIRAQSRPESQRSVASKRKLQGRFLHITDFHPDSHYKTHTSTEVDKACHKSHGPAGYYGAETSDCDTPHSLVNATFEWISANIKDSIDFVIWTGDSARHDSDESLTRTENEVVQSNRMIADKFVSTLSDSNGLAIPVIPTFGNNDILPHNIMLGGPNKWLKHYTDIWSSFIPESERHTFELGGWFYTEVVPNHLAVFSLNTLYFFDRNAGIDDCVNPSEPGFKQLEWLRIQLQFLRNRGMKAILMGHVPPARTANKQNWDETCWQKYTLWLQQYRDVIAASLYGHMNIDHFMLQDTKDINVKLLDEATDEFEAYVAKKKKKQKKRSHEHTDADHEGYSIASSVDYLTDLRDHWAKLPKAAIRALDGNEFSGEKKRGNKKKKKKNKHPLGGRYAERYQLSFVSPSIVPNYFPTLRIYDYNITGLEDSPTWADVIRDSKPKHSDVVHEEDEQEKRLELRDDTPDYEADRKKKKKKKGKHGKKPKDPNLIVPKPPSKTAPPGPAYSPQPLTLTGYTQYFANLTLLNNDAKAFIKEFNTEEDRFQTNSWNEGVHKGKKPGHKPRPLPFEFAVEYTTFDDKIYKLKDLTVRSFVDLAYRIGKVTAGSKELTTDFEDAESPVDSAEAYNDDSEPDSDDDEDGDDEDGDDDGEYETDKTSGKKKKGKKGKKGKKKHKHNKVWLHFLRHAFISTVPDKDLKKL